MFDSGKFKKSYETEIGQKIWEFLNEKENIQKMTFACDLKRAAVDGIHQDFDADFGDILRQQSLKGSTSKDWIKKMVGAMIKQILIDNGYVWAAKGIKCVNGSFFTEGSRYEKKQ